MSETTIRKAVVRWAKQLNARLVPLPEKLPCYRAETGLYCEYLGCNMPEGECLEDCMKERVIP